VDREIEWSPEAVEDIDSIAEYISRDSRFYAQAVVTEILATARNIAEQALIGRIVPETADDRSGNDSYTVIG
jgi:plasmid stabilization system protein ParE